MTRRSFFRSVSAAAVVPSYAFGIEPHWLDHTFPTVTLAPGRLGAPIRILQLSDLHVSNVVPLSLIERAVRMGLETVPDAVCITGDFITNQYAFNEAEYRRILKRLTAHTPCYACLGNHDGGNWTTRVGGYATSDVVRRLLQASGVELLHNRALTAEINEQRIVFAGVGDLWNEEVDAAAAFREVTERPHSATVLLAHNPDTKDLVGDYRWDVMLSGHTHGGQVLVPGIGTRFVAVRDKRFISGLKHWNGKDIYISRGVGNLAGVRLNCRPEVTTLTLTSAPQALDDQYSV